MSRVQSLEKNNYLAEKKKKKTLDTLEKSESIKKRKQIEMSEKYQWLSQKNDHLLKKRLKN